MTVNEVTYYEAVCDEPGCGMKTGDCGSEYSAWADAGQAIDDWVKSDGVMLNDGRLFCHGHTPADYCNEGDDKRHKYDADGDCEFCGERQPATAVSS